MPDSGERRRVLDMLSEGRITAEDAAALLKALGGGEGGPPFPPPRPPKPRSPARSFRVSIDAVGDEGDAKAKIRVNVPIGLARFASRFLPPEAKAQLDAQGIDLSALIDGLGDSELAEGPLVDIDVDDPKTGGKRAKIIIEVV
jgi:hypothetical protein